MKTSNKYYSDIQEKQIAEFLGWRQVSGSGSRPNHPGDIESETHIGECKTHRTPGHKIVFNFSVWDKIKEEANSQFKIPVLFVDDGSQRIENTWCMFESDILVEQYQDYSDSSTFSFTAKHFSMPDIMSFARYGCKYSVISLKHYKEYLELS